MDFLHTLQHFFFVLSLVIFPRSCAGCGRCDVVLCKDCSRLFHFLHSRRITPVMTVFSVARYKGCVRCAILSWKDHDDEELTSYFAHALCRGVEYSIPFLYRCLQTDIHDNTVFMNSQYLSLCVVPVPSSMKSLRKRGRNHIFPLAQAVSQELNQDFSQSGYDVRAHVCPCLSMSKKVRKSVQNSSKAERSMRLNHGLVMKKCDHQSRYAVLVDDIVTTGSTVRSCARVLKDNGKNLVAAYTLADADDEGESDIMR